LDNGTKYNLDITFHIPKVSKCGHTSYGHWPQIGLPCVLIIE